MRDALSSIGNYMKGNMKKFLEKRVRKQKKSWWKKDIIVSASSRKAVYYEDNRNRKFSRRKRL